MPSNDKRKTQQPGNTDDRALEKLEQIWDRQILKGDDFLENRMPSKTEKADFHDEDKPVKQRRRRGRKF
ncbi:hypothetical protein [Ohtaekwangia koreensis]|uniref:Uncharacterized protein n=1 Tax=Ohtaekwangia koreensis TaxID=688867 RepID=A0A1T5MA87_9BACT|nr:hypothetical protein [Ohtaekwangia koreensis]SKC85160.1 hypothetical protein SAMN05660236_4838 [Ohtaekwangia koreensis]